MKGAFSNSESSLQDFRQITESCMFSGSKGPHLSGNSVAIHTVPKPKDCVLTRPCDLRPYDPGIREAEAEGPRAQGHPTASSRPA